MWISSLFLIGSLLGGLANQAYCQEGHHFAITGSGQLTKVSNQNDYNGRSRIDSDVIDEEITPENTYNPAFRIRYTYNFEPQYGFQTGLTYLLTGQQYSGRLDDTTSQAVNYESEVRLDYLRVPFKFRFNSTLNSEVKNVYLSIGVGFSIDILTDVAITNSKASIGRSAAELPGQTIQYSDLYKDVTGNFVADALLNIRLSGQLWVVTGINISYGLGDIENKDFDYPDNTPSELFFPASTKKFNKPDLDTRQRARNTIFGIELGLKYRFPNGSN